VAHQAVDLREHRSGAAACEPESEAAVEPSAPAPAEPGAPSPRPAPLRRLMAGAGAAGGSIAAVGRTLDDAIGAVRSLVVSIAVIVGVGFGTVVVVNELRHRLLVIEPIQIPHALADLGYTSENVARQLKEEIGRIHTASTTFKELPLLATTADLPEIEIPEAETSVRQVLSYLRSYVGAEETRFAGEIIGSETVPYTLYLRSSYGPLAAGLAPEVERDAKQKVACLLQGAAEQIMEQTEPYVLAVALYADRRRGQDQAGKRALGRCAAPAAATDAEAVDVKINRLLDTTLKSGRPEDAPWVYNLKGLLLVDDGHWDQAIRAYGAAVAADRTLAAAHFKGPIAAQVYGLVIGALAYFNQGQVYAIKAAGEKSEADLKKAYGLYQQAVTLDPDKSYIYAGWGHTLYRAGDYQAAADKYREALEKSKQTNELNENLQLELQVRIICTQMELAKSKPEYKKMAKSSLNNLIDEYPSAQIDGVSPKKAFSANDMCKAEHLATKPAKVPDRPMTVVQ
jgi:tetratricopeptide (TPR) repeat protein